MIRGIAIRILPMLSLAWPSMAWAVETVEVFIDQDTRLEQAQAARQRGIEVHVYDVSAVTRIETALSARLPTDPVRAEAMAAQLLTEAVVADIARAWSGPIQARVYGIDRYPALVIDGHTLIYGETNVMRALQRYHDDQRQRGGQ